MADVSFSIEQKEFDELLKKSQRTGAEVEEIINDYLHGDAVTKISDSITGLVPISARNKKHAKNSAPFSRKEEYNLAVKVMTAKEFNYLVFPDEGRGTSRRNLPQDFTGRGLEAVTAELLDDMTARILQKIQE